MSDFSNSHPHERDVYLDAVEIEDSGRQAEFLDRACSNDEHLRARVEALLGVIEQDDLMKSSAAIRGMIENISELVKSAEGG